MPARRKRNLMGETTTRWTRCCYGCCCCGGENCSCSCGYRGCYGYCSSHLGLHGVRCRHRCGNCFAACCCAHCHGARHLDVRCHCHCDCPSRPCSGLSDCAFRSSLSGPFGCPFRACLVCLGLSPNGDALATSLATQVSTCRAASCPCLRTPGALPSWDRSRGTRPSQWSTAQTFRTCFLPAHLCASECGRSTAERAARHAGGTQEAAARRGFRTSPGTREHCAASGPLRESAAPWWREWRPAARGFPGGRAPA